MMFVRCAGGVSHSPLEDVRDDDVMAAGFALYSFLLRELDSDALTVEYGTHTGHHRHHDV